MAHLGVVSVLLEHDLLPKVVTGSSAGSLVTAIIGSNTKEQLKALAREEFRWVLD